METLQHLIASLDIFQVIIKAFPGILNPLIHSLQTGFILLFTSFKHFAELYPGLFSGTVFITAIYALFSLTRRSRKSRIPLSKKMTPGS